MLTSPVDVESLLPLLPLDGLIQQDDSLLVEALGEALHGEVVVGEEQLALGLQVHLALLVMVGLVQGEQVVVNGCVKVAQPTIKGPSVMAFCLYYLRLLTFS